MSAPISLSSSHAEFSAFLLEYFGIEGNTFTVVDARDAARSKSGTWNDFCEKWKESPSDLANLRLLLTRLKKVYVTEPAPRPSAELSPGTKEQLGKLDELGCAAMPNMLDPRKGPRTGFAGKLKEAEKPLTPFDLGSLKAPSSAQLSAKSKSLATLGQKEAEKAAKAAAKVAAKAEADALRARTILVQRPARGWELSPATSKAAKSWAAVETFLGAKKVHARNPNPRPTPYEFLGCPM
jgi:hypothetical protein